MRASSILNLRHLAFKIHPPLPITPRDSQRLLSRLSASFRAQLDKEHGRASSGDSIATDNLLRSILTNPLLSLPQQHGLSPQNGAQQKHGGALIGRPQLTHGLTMSPIEQFKRDIAAGSDSLKVAMHCLSAHLSNRSASAKKKHDSGMPSSTPGVTIINWLWSSGHEENMKFLKDQSFTRVLVSFLVAEGRVLHAWSWFRRLQLELQQDSSGQASTEIINEKTKLQTDLLKALIWSEMRYGAGLNGALKAFVDAFDESSHYDATANDVAERVFQPTGSLLLEKLMAMDSTAAIDPHVIDGLLQRVKSWSRYCERDRACLFLLHPRFPNPYPVLAYIQKSITGSKPPIGTCRHSKFAAALYLKASELLIIEGNHQDAQWVLEHARDAFPQDFGLHRPGAKPAEEKIEQDDRLTFERASLQQLDALASG